MYVKLLIKDWTIILQDSKLKYTKKHFHHIHTLYLQVHTEKTEEEEKEIVKGQRKEPNSQSLTSNMGQIRPNQ
jgi:hypothetical protein